MDPSIQQRIQTDRLLMLREERLARIHDIEKRIEQIIGRPYPLDPPPDYLPSLQRRPRKHR